MNFSALTFLSAITAAVAAPQELSIDSSISASSPIGRSLLSKARSLEGNQNFGWVSGYSIRFEKCASSTDYYASQYFGGNGNNNKGGNQNGYGGMYEQRLVHFKLCPSDSCSSSCGKGGDYVIDMNEFVEAVIQSKLTAQEYDCEQQQTRCEYTCQNANDDEMCQYQCNAEGLSYCNEEQEGGNGNGNNAFQFNLEEAAECRKLEVDKDALKYYMYNSGGGNNQYQFYGNGNGEMGLYVGPYCTTNGKKIMLGVFMDERCSYAADSKLVKSFGLTDRLPYQTESMLDSGCISCKEPSDYDQQYYYDQQDADDVTEICERLYEESGKCETNVQGTYYPNTYACEFIKSLKASGTKYSTRSSSGASAKVFATLFSITTVVFGAAAYFLHQKAKRADISLNGDENGRQLA